MIKRIVLSFIKDLAQKVLDRCDIDQFEGIKMSASEMDKTPNRTEIINYLLKDRSDSSYMEIGVRNPDHNFNHIMAGRKYSVDPGVEFNSNPVDFKMTSDQFFDKLKNGELLNGLFFDVIFIDGLHLAEQAERDIDNSLQYLKEDGFIVLHDCNPPTEWHARESYNYKRTPAKGCWNGTTWKAFAKARRRDDISMCCIDTDWGIGIISKKKVLGKSNNRENPFWEFGIFSDHRKEILNLMTFEEFKSKLSERFI
jgi:hypothetical protein